MSEKGSEQGRVERGRERQGGSKGMSEAGRVGGSECKSE